jgi:AcrR family transcriptional regulator
MALSLNPSPRRPAARRPAVRPRILRQARHYFFTHGYSGFTMDELAGELGLSKKTLYVHFSGKDQIVGAILDDLAREIRADAEAILRHPGLNFAGKVRAFITGMVERLATLDPRTVRDLQRYAPALHARVDDLRRKNIPYIFGRLIEEGRAAGLVRGEPTAPFAIEFLIHAMQGMQQPATLERLQLTPREVIATAVDLFFGGLLTPAGRKQYEKQFSA